MKNKFIISLIAGLCSISLADPLPTMRQLNEKAAEIMTNVSNLIEHIQPGEIYIPGDGINIDSNIISVVNYDNLVTTNNIGEYVPKNLSGYSNDVGFVTSVQVDNKLDSSTMAVLYETNNTYYAGDYVTYKGKLYNCISTTTGEFNTNSWREITLYKNKLYDAEVEYITLGTLYIDSEIISDGNMGFETTFRIDDSVNFGEYGKHLFGQQWNAEMMKLYGYSGGISIDCGTDSIYVTSQAIAKNSFNTYALINKEAFFNGVSKGVMGATQNHYNFTYLIGRAREVNGALQTGYKIHYSNTKLWKDGVLVRDFIPVRKGTAGYYYDKISGRLFGPATAGSIPVGPDKAPPLPEMDGIASAGTSDEYSRFDHVHPTDTNIVNYVNTTSNNLMQVISEIKPSVDMTVISNTINDLIRYAVTDGIMIDGTNYTLVANSEEPEE